ncbi:hypothetical protein DL764_007072 [Monosporascus ibericus]|uniref:Uncharacterized protein n=1 Tax=Monosporascus ibericus TaxID=155417 RepID=A0A4Q4T697_9PEZI|nr:hypothetical protein DL764_007072 [Monosporascus ibericus]
MPRRRTTLGGKKPLRYDSKNLRAMLSGADSALIQEKIRGFAGDLNKNLVDDALAVLFEQANAAVEDPARLSDMMPGEFWGVIKQNVLWASGDSLGGHVVFSLATALVVAHETYDAARPYERFRHQYGKLAEGVHKFSALLKHHHQDNAIVMSFYLDSSVGLPSDDEEEQEEAAELAEGVEVMDIDM